MSEKEYRNPTDLPSKLIEALVAEGHHAEAQLVRLDELLLRLGNMTVEMTEKLADLQIDIPAKLNIASVLLPATSTLTVILNEMRQEGIRTKGIIDLATRGR